jgi:hypothetical protein
LDGLLLDGAGARYEGVDLGEGRDCTEGRELGRDEDRTAGRETVRWEVGLDRLELETEGLAWLRGVRLVTDPLDPDEDREILRLEEEGRDDRWVRVGVRVTLAPDRPLDRELERCRVNVRLDPVRLGRLTLDGREGARTREFPERETEGVDGLRLLRLVTDSLDPDEDREILRLEVEERAGCEAWVRERLRLSRDRPCCRESDRWRVIARVGPVRSERLTVDRREPPFTTRSRVRSAGLEASLEERTPLLEFTEFGPRTRGRRSSLGRP